MTYTISSHCDAWTVTSNEDELEVTVASSVHAMPVAYAIAAFLNRLGHLDRATVAAEILTDDARAADYKVSELGGKSADVVPLHAPRLGDWRRGGKE